MFSESRDSERFGQNIVACTVLEKRKGEMAGEDVGGHKVADVNVASMINVDLQESDIDSLDTSLNSVT